MDALETLLLDWNCIEVLPILKEHAVTVQRLKYLTAEDIREMIPLVGPRAEFREKLFRWIKQKYSTEDQNKISNLSANTSTTSKVSNWMENNISPSPINAFSIDVLAILNDCRKGLAMQKFYKNNNFLTDAHRNEMITIILEAFVERDIKLQRKDFERISKQIVAAFPTEAEDYYYVSGLKRKSKYPGGKMYDKYGRLCNKRKRQINASTNVTVDLPMQDIKEENCLEFEDESLLKIKLNMQNDINAVWCFDSDPPTVNEKWQDTYYLRRKDLTESNDANFTLEWLAYKQTYGYKLFHYDFSVLYAGKENALLEKWYTFKQLIYGYYEENLKNKSSREEFAVCKQISSQESVNYILARLLNGIMVPTARFQMNVGDKSTRKYSISDSNVCFVVHLTDITKLYTELVYVREKYYAAASPLQPVMIVVGADIYKLHEFYVYFDGFLYQFDTFVECLSTAFQIFKVLNLTYPKACQHAWVFIQKYFYAIDDSNDLVPSVLSVLNYLQRNTLN